MMFEIIFDSALLVAAFLAAIFSYIAVIGAVQLNLKRDTGWFPSIFYIIFATVAASTIDSGRNLSQGTYALLLTDAVARSAWGTWFQRLATICILVIAFERIGSAVFSKKAVHLPKWLMFGFVLYWFGVIASPAFLSSHPNFSYEYTYPLIIGIAGFLLNAEECDQSITAARNATLVFILLSVAFLAIQPSLVMETNYTQGFIPGLPRLAGLSAHALQLGLVVQVAMLCLWAKPLPGAWLTRVAWLLCLAVFFLAQSKTAWISFALCAAVMLLVRNGSSVRKWVFDNTRPAQGVVTIIGLLLLLLGAAYALVFSKLGNKLLGFLSSEEGANLLTLNGRSQIWDIALQEWSQNPVFGYGPSFLDLAYRTSVGLLNAVHAHNQFFDDLARAGLVGAISLVIYVLILFVLSLRYAGATQGLSIALFLIMFIRGVSEVPLSMYGYGADFAIQLLLAVILLGASATSAKARRDA